MTTQYGAVMRRRIAAIALAGALLLATTPTAIAKPSPPTNGR
jgi:hypothetical protein